MLRYPYEPGHEKTCYQGFRPGPTQLGCTAKKDGLTLEILDLGSRGSVPSL